MLALIFTRATHADRHRLDAGVVDVGGDDHPPAGDLLAHVLGGEDARALRPRHLGRYDSFASKVELRAAAASGERRFYRASLSSLRWYEPDQVRRVVTLGSAISAPRTGTPRDLSCGAAD